MSENKQESRADRIARYKEERKKQLAEQFGNLESRKNNGSPSSSTDCGTRTNRAAKLRAQAILSNGSSHSQGNRASNSSLEKTDLKCTSSKTVERDKSSKRKSNLNRNLTSEEIPNDSDDPKTRRRRRRFFSADVLEQAKNQSPNPKDDVTNHVVRKCDTTPPSTPQQTTATSNFYHYHRNSPSPSFTANNSGSGRSTPRKSLSIDKKSSDKKQPPELLSLSAHMENARRGVTPSFSEMGRYKPFSKRAVTNTGVSSTSKEKLNPGVKLLGAQKLSSSYSDRENSRCKDITPRKSSASDNETLTTRNVAKRMEELTAITRETLARVEKLANSSRKDLKTADPTRTTSRPRFPAQPSSILKKKTIAPLPNKLDTSLPLQTTSTTHYQAPPVSILKRKVVQDDPTKTEHSNTHTPPVTFSPSVVEPSTSKRKQGILKKRRSLDESTVMRHRSCSPDVANSSKTDSSKSSILKNQKRRSSLEELRLTQSPEIVLHGILKRKPSKLDDEDHSLNSPQSILKRRSGASSAGSTGNTPHVSITTAVILAAAGGAEMVLKSDSTQTESVRPILKKKSFSDEHSYSESSTETPRPILKKKSSTDTDDGEERERPKPILKIPRSSIDREVSDTNQDSGMEVRPILKSSNSLRAESPRPRLSFSSNDSEFRTNENSPARSRRSYTICADYNLQSNAIGVNRDEDRTLRKARPLSVQELVMSFEKSAISTGAIPKKSAGNKRNSDRHRTQPVTSHELEQSLNLVNHNSDNHQNSFNFSTSSSYSLEDDGTSLNSIWNSSLYHHKSSFKTSSHSNSFQSSVVSPSSPFCQKMSSDSAFQSLGDGLELEAEEESQNEVKAKVEPLKLADQMKAIADEAKKMRLNKVNAGVEKYRTKKVVGGDRVQSRFSTQPVTFNEVQEAARLGNTSQESDDSRLLDTDAFNLSLSEKVRKFEMVVKGLEQRKRRHTVSSPPVHNIDETLPERKTILKPPLTVISPPFNASAASQKLPPASRVSRKKTNDDVSSKSALGLEKEDEGISSDNHSDSDEKETYAKSEKVPKFRINRPLEGSSDEGESSGGREVKNIFKNERGKLNLDFKKTLEGVLSKSKSQIMCGAYDDVSTYKKSSSSGLRRSQTHTPSVMPQSIADLRAKLQESGETGWKKRVPQNNKPTDELKLLKEKNRKNDEQWDKPLLAVKKDELDTAAHQWKNRVEKSDAEKYTVAGKMEEKIKNAVPTINIPVIPGNKRSPAPKVYKGKSGTESSSTPSSPEKSTLLDLSRSKSVPYPPLSQQETSLISNKLVPRKVAVPQPDDFTFRTFFQSVEHAKTKDERLDVRPEDFDAIERNQLLVIKKNVQVRRRRGATRNPIKALASRTDITNEYTEVITGIAERETKRLNIERLAVNSNKAIEALAGLASNEDFKSVALKKGTGPTLLLPWKPLMLLQIKGRRHVQTRLVEPVVTSLNEGDCFVLITPAVVYNYVGAYSNVIEQSRAADVVNHVRKTNDMGCKNCKIVTITDRSAAPKAFWNLLGSQNVPETVEAGHPSEDETYESNILHTNMIYTLKNNELVPHDDFWGTVPKIEMLQETSVLVFDFGSELYVWSGKNAAPDRKRTALKLAKDMWDEGYNYNDCTICPLNIASILGDREQSSLPLTAKKRPDWALFAKITQHRETVLFREKFLDWPDFSRVIRVKSDDNVKQSLSGSYDIKPCDVDTMTRFGPSEPDLVVDKHTHLGRGDSYFDKETNRLFEYDTVEIKAWKITENTHEELDAQSIGQFYDTDSYIYSWKYRQTVKGRELSGKPSKHSQVGRDKSVFFCWQGAKSSVSEKCTAAFLTVELDKENAPQIRVAQGFEPAAFLRLFAGGMVIHNGGSGEKPARLYVTRGEIPAETYLMEVPAEMSSLRSRTSFVISYRERGQVTIWHGCKAGERKRTAANACARKLIAREFDFSRAEVIEVNEGSENEDFFDAIGNDRSSYWSLLDVGKRGDYSTRLFAMSSVTGCFEASEVLCPHRSEFASPFPFVQSELYSASQPALYLVDNDSDLWLWQGWWPEKDEDDYNDTELSDQTGSGAVRWQAERRAAMQTAVNYWRKKKEGRENEDDTEEENNMYLVWAGLEPLEFRNLFPNWEQNDDVADLNQKEGKTPNEKLPLRAELARLSRTTYPLSEILQRPLPDGVDPTQLEIYLSPDDFRELLSMTHDEFRQLPSWKQTALKKEKGLF